MKEPESYEKVGHQAPLPERGRSPSGEPTAAEENDERLKEVDEHLQRSRRALERAREDATDDEDLLGPIGGVEDEDDER